VPQIAIFLMHSKILFLAGMVVMKLKEVDAPGLHLAVARLAYSSPPQLSVPNQYDFNRPSTARQPTATEACGV